jgi:hypothetical protein
MNEVNIKDWSYNGRSKQLKADFGNTIFILLSLDEYEFNPAKNYLHFLTF